MLGLAALHELPRTERCAQVYVHAAQGMTQLVRERPDNPVEFLAHYLLQHAAAAKAAPAQVEPAEAAPATAAPAEPEAAPPPAEPAAAASKT